MKLGRHDLYGKTIPYIIAEVGVNHEGSIEKAFQMISEVAQAGANGVKFQTYKADKIAAKDSPAYWDLAMEPTTSQYELFKKHDSFNEDDYIKCKECCDLEGVDFLSTAFDLNSLDFVDDLVPFHKVSSSDITNIPFLRAVGRTKKPVVLSTGASTYAEIDRAVAELQNHEAEGIVLLHCILNYPTPYNNANIDMILGLQERYPNCLVGLSDHTLADPKMLSVTAAYCLGAKVIEKHYTYDKSIFGSDHKHSMDKRDLSILIENIKFISPLFGSRERVVLEEEEISRANARRSIFFSRNMKAGEVIGEDDLICKRPALWVSSENWDEAVGKVLTKDCENDAPFDWKDIS